jgi:hypothetical protein
MNCWGIRIYFTKSRFSLNWGYIVYTELLSGHEKIITKSGIFKCGNIKSGLYCMYLVHQTAASREFGKEMKQWLATKFLLKEDSQLVDIHVRLVMKKHKSQGQKELQQNSFKLKPNNSWNPDDPALEENSPKTEVLLFTLKKLHQQKW